MTEQDNQSYLRRRSTSASTCPRSQFDTRIAGQDLNRDQQFVQSQMLLLPEPDHDAHAQRHGAGPRLPDHAGRL